MSTPPPPGDRRLGRAFPIAAGLVAFAIVFCACAPRFVYWPGIGLPSSPHNPPEVNRAIDTLRQLDRPFVPIKNPTNRVVNWRLLFPILGHALHLPPSAFLALPFLGSVLVLGWAARLVERESGDRRAALLAATLLATASWFFVSTGWLAYFDSWCLLGMLIVTFARSSAATALACLLTPWVDERFLLALPLCLAARGAYFGGTGRAPRARLAAEGVRAVALVAPYFAIRLVAMSWAGDAGSAAHLEEHLALRHDPREVLYGLWSGLRALWFFAAASVGLCLVRRGERCWGLLLGLAIPATAVGNVMVARDLSRSASAAVPAALLGILLLLRRRPVPARWLLAAALVVNLLIPAEHIVEGWDEPIRIRNIALEIRKSRSPIPEVAQLYVSRGAEFTRRGDRRRALREFDTAIRIDPTLAPARIHRAECLAWLSRVAESEAGFEAAIRLAPRDPHVYMVRGPLRNLRGDLRGAAADLRRALELSPANAPYRPELEHALAQVLGTLGGE